VSKLTNDYNLPDAVFRAVVGDPYTKGNSDISATELIDAPRARALRIKHHDQVTEDISDRCFSLLGQAFHSILEKYAAPGTVSEERLYLDVNGLIVSGSIDLQKANPRSNAVEISDWKVTSTYKYNNSHEDWESQLNIYAALVRETKDVEVSGLNIVAFFRDWTKSKTGNDEYYPPAPICTIPIRMWEHKDAMDYIKERVDLHLEAREAMLLDEPIPQCSRKDRWENPPEYAVTKIGGKRATSKHKSKKEAEAACGPGYFIETRGGEPRRCLNFCTVSKFCDQFQSWKKANEE
jgi:hypothetical protein